VENPLKLSTDSTYYYKYELGYKLNISSGTWRTDCNNFLLLKSTYSDLLNLPIKIIERKKQNSVDSISFVINDEFRKDNDESYYIIVINDSIEKTSKNSHFQSTYHGTIFKLKVLFIGTFSGFPYQTQDTVESEVYSVNDPASNVFEIDWKYNFEIFYYKVFNYDTLDIKNKYLYMRNNIRLVKES
jgi:hypothetical protein